MTKRRVQVYGWQAFQGGEQVRAIVAASSKAGAARLAGYDRPTQMHCLSVTRNPAEIDAAMTHPGTPLARSIYARPGDPFTPLTRRKAHP